MDAFERWYAQFEHPGMTADEVAERDRCRQAWDEAVAAERGRCAKLALAALDAEEYDPQGDYAPARGAGSLRAVYNRIREGA